MKKCSIAHTKSRPTLTTILMMISLFLLLSMPLVTGGNQKAPDFTVKTAENESFTLSDQKKPIVIEFMSSLCVDCKVAEENLKQIYVDHEDDFVFISIDITDPSLDELQRLKDEREIPWKVGQGDAELFSTYQGTSVPKLVMVDTEGYITFEKTGIVSEQEIKENMDDIIRGDAEPIEFTEYGVYGLAVMGGVASFFSPCSFPLLPSYFAYYVRPGEKEDKKEDKKTSRKIDHRGLKMGLKASLGMIIVFGGIGALIVTGGNWLADYVPYLQPLVGGVITFSGLLILSDVDLSFHLQNLKNRIITKERKKKNRDKTHLSPFYYGLGYGMGSAGCTIPVFIAVIVASWLTQGISGALTVLLLYLLPMVFLMTVISILIYDLRGEIIKKLNRYIRLINRISGMILVVAGISLLLVFFFL